MFAIINRLASAVETSAAWSQNDVEQKQLYHARLFSAIIETDGGKLFKTVEWVVTREYDDNFVMTVPLCFGVRHRNCKILQDTEILPGSKPFNANEEEMIFTDDGYVPLAPDPAPLNVVFRDGKLEIL